MTNDQFLPEGTEIPAAGQNYMKLLPGENKIRVLSSAITGYELWINKKPLRHKKNDFTTEQIADADATNYGPGKPFYFWAFLVWNYAEEKVQILEIKQKTVMKGMDSYLKDEDFGNPRNYDLVIVKPGEGEKDYVVKAKPPKPLDEGISVYAKDLNVNLSALYEGKDPFQNDVEVTNEDEEDFEKSMEVNK